MIKKFAIALSTTCLVPLAALAQSDDFGIADTPAEKPKPAYFNHVEAGVGYSSLAPQPFGRYTGLGEDKVVPGGSLYYLYRGPWDGTDTSYVKADGAAIGTDARRLRLEGGEQGAYKLFFGYDASTFRDFRATTPFVNEGGDHLGLVSGWTRNNTVTNLSTSAMRQVDIKTDRERFGSGLTWKIDPQWALRMAARHEVKEGLKPVGVYSGANSVIAPEPVNYQDDRIETDLSFTSKRVQARIGYHYSLFQNEDTSLTIATPFLTHAHDRMGLAPDNSAHSFFADGGVQLTDTTRLVTNLSYSQYLQDEGFLPYAVNNNTLTSSLPRDSLDGRIATTVANMELTSKPVSRFDVKTRYRFTNRRNDTPVSEFIYIMTDEGAQDPNVSNQARRRRNVPYSYQENLASADVGYELTPRAKLTTGYEFRAFERTHSERAKNIDNTVHVGVRGRIADGLNGSAKVSRMWRDGSTYSPQGSLVHTNSPTWARANPYDNHPWLRKFYEADVVRDRVQAGVTYNPTEALTLGLTGGVSVDEYVRTQLGLTDVVGTNVTLDVNYVLSPDFWINSFYTYERRVTDQAGQNPAATNALTDTNRLWFVNIADDAHTAGIGSRWQAREGLALLFDYTFVWTVMEVDPTRREGSTATPAASSFPDITSKSHVISARAEYDLTDQVVLGLGYAIEMYRSKDWALDYNPNSYVNVLNMGETSPNYDAHLIMATTRYKF